MKIFVNQFLAILYRSFHQYKKAILFGIVIIGWGLTNAFVSEQTSEQMPFPINFFVILYVFLITFQFQSVFAHGMVDDRESKFRSIYSIMGLQNSNYLIAQYISFVVIEFFTVCIFYVLVIYYKYTTLVEGESIFDKALLEAFFQGIIIIFQASAFTITISYLFKTPTLARDISFIFHFVIMFIVMYFVINDKYQFLKYLLPYFTTTKYLINQTKDMAMGMIPIGSEETPESNIFSDLFQTSLQVALNILIFFYIDNIYPSEDDNQKDFLFFLDYFKLRKNRSDVEDIQRFLQKDIKDVENKPQVKSDLSVIGLNKKFGNFQALYDINMNLNKGHVYSLLGHNGAGKSTIVNILTGIHKPTSGKILWQGKDFRYIKQNLMTNKDVEIGICPSFDCLQPSLTVYQHLKVIGLIKNIRNLELKIQQILNLLNIKQYEKFQTSKLSGGNKRKLSLGIALMGEVNLLFLDEPTSSIDPVSRKEIWEILLTLKKNANMITLLTTHHLEEAELLSDDIQVLSFGKIVAQGPVDQIKKSFGVGFQIEVFPKSGVKDFITQLEEIKNQVESQFSQDLKVKLVKRKLIIDISDDNIQGVKKILKYLQDQNFEKFSFDMNSNTLEKAFLEIDKQQHKEIDYDTQGFEDYMIRDLYTYKVPNFMKKILLIAFNKLQFLLSDYLELLKILITYAIVCYFFWFVLYLVDDLYSGIEGFILPVLFIAFIIIELSLFSYGAYNYVYDNSNNIKTLLHANKVTILQYFLGKLLADLIMNLIIYVILYQSLYKIFLMFQTPAEFEDLLYYSLIRIFFWKMNYSCQAYLIGKVFSEPKQVLKYFSLVYSSYFGLLGFINFLISKFIIKTSLIVKISDLYWILQFYGEKNQSFFKAFWVFSLYIIIYGGILIYIEHYDINFNYVEQNLKAPLKDQISRSNDKKTNSSLFLDQNDSVQKEEDETFSNRKIFFRALSLYKHYKKFLFWGKNKIAVKNISFGIDKQMTFGLVGPNGAGKSTTFNMILSKVLKSGGNLKFNNVKYEQQSITKYLQRSIYEKNNFGISFQGNALWENMNVLKNLSFYAKLNNVNQKILMDLVKYFDFDSYLKKKVKELSSGNKRKLCILISILNNPNIILYDEATCGVDIMIRHKLKILLEYLKKKNNTISIFTTHFLKDIEVFCDKLGLIKQGQFVCVDYIENIKNSLGGYLIRFQKMDVLKKSQVEILLKEQGNFEIARIINISGVTHHQYFLYNNKKLTDLFNLLVMLKDQKFISDFSLNQLSIEDIYLNLLSEEENE